MHDVSNVGPRIIFRFGDSGVYVTESVVFGAIVALVLIVLALWLTRNMKAIPTGKQVFAEFIVSTIYNLVEGTMLQTYHS